MTTPQLSAVRRAERPVAAVEAPLPLLDLPTASVKAAVKEAVDKLRQDDKSKGPRALISFRKKLPVVGSPPNRQIATSALAATFALADDVAPKHAVLQRLLTPK